MFKKTTSKTQLGIFSSPDYLLSGRSEDFYGNHNSWHNLFRVHITLRIDESIFKPLFTEQTGAPNASVRALISMMILKEANGWSDQQLFEQCRFNLLARSALGLINMDDKVPTESTYYLLRKRIFEYEKAMGINLIEKSFISITKSQVADFEISGKTIRMDSKLLGSNIAWFSRYELIHETMRLFCKDIGESLLTNPLLASRKEELKNLLNETGNKVVYKSTRDELKIKMQQLGTLLFTFIDIFSPTCSKHYTTLQRIFTDQYKVEDDKKIIIRDKEENRTDSVQSPHDTDCHYRNKNGNKIKGYSINITESCNNGKFNIVSGVDVRQVSTSDNEFLQNSIEQAKEIFNDSTTRVHTDGAYHSVDNQEYCKSENIDFCIGSLSGPKARFDLFLNNNGQLTVHDTKTGKTIQAIKQKNKDKWQIKVDGNYRYFTTKHITTSALKRKIAAIPQEVLNVRNNVEATIFQLGYHYPHDKSRYRGLIKHKMWANLRGLWINFVRILKYINKTGNELLFWPNYNPSFSFLAAIFSILLIKPVKYPNYS